MKVLLKKPLININILKDLKEDQHQITYNENEPNIDIVIDDMNIYFKNYPNFSMSYTHWIQKDTDLSFIVNLLEDTLKELNCYSF